MKNEKCKICGKTECIKEDSCMWKALKNDRQDKKYENFQNTVKILDSKGVKYKLHQQNYQFTVGNWIFWAGTGKFKHKHNAESGRGLNNFLKKITQEL